MAIERTTRYLSGLQGAASGRVLNLALVAQANAANAQHRAAPFFESTVLNGAILVKHRLRADERDLFVTPRLLATKIIIPFEKGDLRAGGQSLFIGQRGFEDLVRDVGNYRDRSLMKQDLDILRLLDGIPSLDPFLLREAMRTLGRMPDACYFGISRADQQRLQPDVAEELNGLKAILSRHGGGGEDAVTKLAAAILSGDMNEGLAPLSAALGLDGEAFAECLFNWRAMLYYKWSLADLWPKLMQALRDLKAVRATERLDDRQAALLAASKQSIIEDIKMNNEAIRKTLALYDNAYAGLVASGDPKSLKEFLQGASSHMIELGTKIGLMAHLTSFWQYRYPDGAPRTVGTDELITIFHDFAHGFDMDLGFLKAA